MEQHYPQQIIKMWTKKDTFQYNGKTIQNLDNKFKKYNMPITFKTWTKIKN